MGQAPIAQAVNSVRGWHCDRSQSHLLHMSRKRIMKYLRYCSDPNTTSGSSEQRADLVDGRIGRHSRKSLLMMLALLAMSAAAEAQQSRDKTRRDDPSTQQLATRITKAEEALLKEYLTVVDEYYKQGAREAAVEVLQRIAVIDPKLPGIKERISSINEEMLQENGIRSDLDVSKSWTAICDVEAGRPFRLQATGDYKLDFVTTVPVTGLSTSDPRQDHIAAAPFGALIGVVLTDGKPGDPFPVNGTLEHTPKKSGQLYLRVNVPMAAKCKGDLKLQISGAVKPLPRQR
jgi:hypothetical protein